MRSIQSDGLVRCKAGHALSDVLFRCVLTVVLFMLIPMMGIGAASAEASALGGPVSRAEILQRAQVWVDHGVPYSQTQERAKWFRIPGDDAAYRPDCSGYVSGAWHLNISATTASLPAYATQLPSYEHLRPGDILLYRTGTGNNAHGHTVIFIEWTNASHTAMRVYEERAPGYNALINTRYVRDLLAYSYKAYRYKNVIDSPVITGSSDVQGTRQFMAWSDGSLRLSHWNGSAWQHDSFGLVVKTGSNPSAYMGSNSTQWIAWVDSSSVLRLSHWTGSAWQNDNFGMAVAEGTSPSAFNGPGNNPNIAWVDAGGKLRLSHWNGSAWQHDNFSGLNVRAGSSPSAYVNDSGLRWIAWIDTTGVLRLSHWTGSAWQHDNFGMAAAAGTSPNAFNGPGNNPNMTWVDSSGKLRLSHWNGSAWQHDNFSGLSVRAGSSPSAYVGTDGLRWIAWIDHTGVLRLSHWTGTVWQHDNFGVATAAGTSPSAYVGPSNQPHIAWVDSSGKLRLSHWNGSAWQHDNFGFILPSGASPSAYLG